MREEQPLSNFNFGEYDARREYLRDSAFFNRSFVDPISFQLGSLRADRNFIIVGQKDAGKTACQIQLESVKQYQEGYLCDLISFYDDLRAEDYTEFAKTQKMELVSISDAGSLDLMYDFKEVWKRLIFLRVAKLLHRNGFNNVFVAYCLSSVSGSNKLLDGLKRSIKVEVKLPLMALEAKVHSIHLFSRVKNSL